MINLFRVRSLRLQAFAVAAMAVFMASEGQAQRSQADAAAWRERCKQWLERKGYPVDYIEIKTGKRQSGMAVSWKGNLKPEDVQAGDVVISSRTVDRECFVTETFGQVSRWREPLSTVLRVWRPSLPLE